MFKAKRKKLGLSQFALAKKARVSRFRISQAECGYLKLTKDEIGKIKKVLKCR